MKSFFSLDIETECTQGCTAKCDHALAPYTSKITLIGVYQQSGNEIFQECFTSPESFFDWWNTELNSSERPPELIGHNLKFDLKHLLWNGIDLRPFWAHDTQVMAHASLTKVSPEYQEWYEAQRKEQNKLLHKGYSHREAGKYSLKMLAPYFVGAQAFWENPANHNDPEYCLKDCEYTWKLWAFFTAKLAQEKQQRFYEEFLMPCSKMIMESELHGIPINMQALLQEEQLTKKKLVEAKDLLIEKYWGEPITAYHHMKCDQAKREYEAKKSLAIGKLKEPTPANIEKVQKKYDVLFAKNFHKIDRQFNFDSPQQLLWLFRDYYKLDIKDIDGKDSTGKPIIQRLASEGREDVQVFFEYRQQQKLITSFFESYKKLQHDGSLYPSFNLTGTRTGRLSSSNPNCQQIPAGLHKLFEAPPGHLLATYDMTAIEAKLIAYYSDDPILYELVTSGRDFHGFNAQLYFSLPEDNKEIKAKYPVERKFAKELGYALFYGAGWRRIQEVSRKYGFNWKQNECRDKFEVFKETYRKVFEFKADLDKEALNEPIVNLFGRAVSYPDPFDIHMKAFNTLIQSSASDMVLKSALRIFNAGYLPLLYVHDEIVTLIKEEEAAQAEAAIKEAMTNYDLQTARGPIQLEVEGKVSRKWEK